MTGATFNNLTALESTLSARECENKQDNALRDGSQAAFDACMKIATTSTSADMRKR